MAAMAATPIKTSKPVETSKIDALGVAPAASESQRLEINSKILVGIKDSRERDEYFCQYFLSTFFIPAESRLSLSGRRVVANRNSISGFDRICLECLCRYLFYATKGNLPQMSDIFGLTLSSLFELMRDFGISASSVNNASMPDNLPELWVGTMAKPDALNRAKLERVADDMMDTAIIAADYIRNDLPTMKPNERIRVLETMTKVAGELQVIVSARIKDKKKVNGGADRKAEALIGLLVKQYGWKPENIIGKSVDEIIPNGRNPKTKGPD